MTLTFGITGMDGKTEAELVAAFDAANAASGQRWTKTQGDDADVVAVDMDSLYGPMSWLRLQSAGRTVIGLTAGERSQTPYRLGRPVSSDALAAILSQLAETLGHPADPTQPEPSRTDATVDDAAAQPSPAAAPVMAEVPAPVPAAPPAHATPAPTPADHLPPAAAMQDDITEAAPLQAPVLAPATPDEHRLPEAAAPAAPQAPAMPSEMPLAEWLQAGRLATRVRLHGEGAPALLIDPQARVWHGPAALKSVAPSFREALSADRFEAIDDPTWDREAAAIGAAQPIARLQWLGGLLAGNGALAAGMDPATRFRLGKWPQTEREYPKHFRIATAMMKGPCTLDELADASGVDRADVADFINANLATGFAEPYVEPQPEPPEASKPSGGLFGRMRGR